MKTTDIKLFSNLRKIRRHCTKQGRCLFSKLFSNASFLEIKPGDWLVKALRPS